MWTYPSWPDVEPPPALPTPPPAGWRWPWLLATLALTLTAGTLWVGTIPRVFQFLGTSNDGDYTEWVYSPLTWAYFLTAVIGVVAGVLLCVPQWKQRTRLLVFALFALFSLTIGIRGQHESAARRHIAPQLLAAVDAFQTPSGVNPSGAVVETFDGGSPPDDVLPEPWTSRSWTLPTDSAAAACAAVGQMIAGERGWKPQGVGWDCGFERRQRRLCLRIGGDSPLRSVPETIEVSAFPRDGFNC